MPLQSRVQTHGLPEDENIAFKTNENGVKVTWKSYEYDPSITTDQAATAKMTDDDLPK